MDDRRDQRSPERLRAHYDIEKTLAARLRNAPTDERTVLYSAVYDELFRTVPDHPQLTRKADPAAHAAGIDRQVQVLSRFLGPHCTFLELGAGDCRLSYAVAGKVGKVYAIDVSDEITRGNERPSNFSLLLTDGIDVPVPPSSIDVAYSNQLMEHLHPEDALAQLENVFRSLKPGGVYVCATPNRLTGPHDISRHFDVVAQGFHLKEYTTRELRQLLSEVGFERIRNVVRVKRFVLVLPSAPLAALEWLMENLPGALFHRARRLIPERSFPGRVVAVKPGPGAHGLPA